MTTSTSASGPVITSPIVMGGDAPVVESPIVDPAAPVQTVVAPVAEAVVTTAPAPAAGDPVVTEAAAPETPPAPNADMNKSTPEWAQKRINDLTALRHAQERTARAEKERADRLERTNAELLARMAGAPPAIDPATGQPVVTPPTPQVTEEEIRRRINEEAAAIAARTKFNEACNAVAETGKTEFKDSWDDALKNLGLVGAIGPDVSTEFLETALELKNPAKILNHLGSNIEEAERIAKLSPKKMALEMARMEAQLNTPAPVVAAPVAPVIPPISTAPAPVIPLGGAAKPGAASIDDPNISTEEFMKLRAEQALMRQKRYTRA